LKFTADDLVDLPHIAAPTASDAADVFHRDVVPIITGLGVTCELVETYSIARCCEIVRENGANYLVYDHALLDCFRLLDALTKPGLPIAMVAAALHRVFAESARSAQLMALYLFYLHRAREVQTMFSDIPSRRLSAADNRWQTLLVLLHEAGHVAPRGHPAREAIDFQAQLLASGMLSEQIAAFSGRLSALLDDDPLGQQAREAQEDWAATRDDLNLGDEAISETLHAVATDPRFLSEIASDAFALAGIKNLLAAELAPMKTADAERLVCGALLAVSRSLLHMRLLAYIDGIAENLPVHLDAAQVDPLLLRMMVEMNFRSNITVREIADMARDLCGEQFAQALRLDLAEQQIRHTKSLIDSASILIDSTLINQGFHGRLESLLAEDGIDAKELEDDPFNTIAAGDEIWYELAGVSALPASQNVLRRR
jgi:hypothetical protein